MNDVIQSMLDLFGISTVPTNFSEFMFWFCSLIAGLVFVLSLVRIMFSFGRDLGGITK